MIIVANISIDFDSTNNEIHLLGDIAALQKNRFAWRYVRDYLHPRIMGDQLIIPIEDDEPFSVMSSISGRPAHAVDAHDAQRFLIIQSIE